MPSSLAGSKSTHLRKCSSDRKRFIWLQARAISSRQDEYAMLEWPTTPGGSTESSSPSRIRTRIGSPQSRHGQSMRTSCLGKSQHTASDSNPHCPYQRSEERRVIKYCVGKLANGAKDSM